eukprot:5818037-Pyramimonas_sp.AAC.1
MTRFCEGIREHLQRQSLGGVAASAVRDCEPGVLWGRGSSGRLREERPIVGVCNRGREPLRELRRPC